MIPAKLTEKFHHTQVKKNQSGQDYVSIDGYINRLNEVMGHAWSFRINKSDIYFGVAPDTKNGKPQYVALVQGTLSMILSDVGVISMEDSDGESYLTEQKAMVSRDGVGASTNFDADTAIKTAQAEALKKACHQFGIALYLWSEVERSFIALQRQAVNNDVALKGLAVAYTQREREMDPGVMPDKDTICSVLGIKDLDVSVIRNRFIELGVL